MCSSDLLWNKFGSPSDFDALKLMRQDNMLRICASLAFPWNESSILIERAPDLEEAVITLRSVGRADAGRKNVALQSDKVEE